MYLQNEWPTIDTGFHKHEVVANFASILTRLVGSPELFQPFKYNDKTTKKPLITKLESGRKSLLSVLEKLKR